MLSSWTAISTPDETGLMGATTPPAAATPWSATAYSGTFGRQMATTSPFSIPRAANAAAAAATASPWLVPPAAVVLGTGYGCCLVSGLLQTQRIAAPGELAGLTAVYYALTYVGFAAPVVLALLAMLVPYWVLLLGAAALAALTLAVSTPRKDAVSAP